MSESAISKKEKTKKRKEIPNEEKSIKKRKTQGVLTKQNIALRFPNAKIIRLSAQEFSDNGLLVKPLGETWSRMNSDVILTHIPNKILANFMQKCFEVETKVQFEQQQGKSNEKKLKMRQKHE